MHHEKEQFSNYVVFISVHKVKGKKSSKYWMKWARKIVPIDLIIIMVTPFRTAF